MKWIAAIALILIAFYAVSKVPLRMMSVFSVSQINLQTGGYEDPNTHEWKNSYWVIGLVTDTLEHYEGITYTFDSREAEGHNKIGEKTLVVNSEVKIRIIPQRPYYERSMRYVTYTVYPKTYGTWMNKLSGGGMLGKLESDEYAIPGLNVTVMQFTDESWKLYTPFKIQLYKNGVLKDEQVVNTLGGTETITLTADSPEETVKVQNLGKLGTGLGEPAFGDLIIFDEAHIFKIEGNIINEIQYDKDPYSFSNYWFGGGEHYYAVATYGSGPVMRWPDGTPAHYWKWGSINEPIENYMFPGVYREDTATDYRMLPYQADIFNDKPQGVPIPNSTGPYGETIPGTPFGYSLVNYLANERGHSLYTLSDFDEYNQGVEIVDNKLRLYLPLSSFNNLVTVWISTEAADAIVYQPVPSKGVITSIEWLGTGDISDKDMAKVTVKQESQDGGRVTVTVSGTEGYPVSVSPTTDSAILDYGESHTFFFTVKNLGTSTVQSGTLTFTVTNDLGEQTDQKTLDFKLEPQIGDKTILTVNLYDEDGVKPSGITVTVNYGIDSKSGVSSSGYITFDLGTYKGSVSIATQETDTYKSAAATATVDAGQNSVYLQLVKKGKPATLWDLLLEWIRENMSLVVVCTVGLAVIGGAVYMSRKKR